VPHQNARGRALREAETWGYIRRLRAHVGRNYGQSELAAKTGGHELLLLHRGGADVVNSGARRLFVRRWRRHRAAGV
jgi:hypothetical protein